MDHSVKANQPSQYAGLISTYAITALVLIVVGAIAYALPPDRGATGNALIAVACTAPLLLAVIAVRTAWRYLTRP